MNFFTIYRVGKIKSFLMKFVPHTHEWTPSVDASTRKFVCNTFFWCSRCGKTVPELFTDEYGHDLIRLPVRKCLKIYTRDELWEKGWYIRFGILFKRKLLTKKHNYTFKKKSDKILQP